MKKKRITYGVNGMMEYQAVVKVGRNNMKVNFTDGSMNAMGVNPAKFTTSNFMVQHAIENSLDFKKGRIFIFQVIELDEELRIERPTPAKGAAEVKPAETPVAEEAPENKPADAPIAEETPESETTDAEESAEESASEIATEIATGNKVEVEFSVNDDARDYLEQNYGAERSKLRTRADILAAAETYGVDIKFV